MERQPRRLLVTADDFGIGPETTRGILELSETGAITSTVMLVNSPYAREAVQQWRQTHSTLEVGWHPCLTMDRPILPAEQVPSLVNAEGKFYNLGKFLFRLRRGVIREAELHAELAAQYRRYVDLMGKVPVNVNGHHHVHIFGPVRRVLMELMEHQYPRPFLRRVQEPWRTLWSVSGIRLKRFLMSELGCRSARKQEAAGYPGADWLLGITDPPLMEATDFFTRWLSVAPGDVVELMCHPGHDDVTLLGRDATPTNGQRERRVHEWYRLQSPSFREAVQRNEFVMVRAGELVTNTSASLRQAA